jgi:hypothetical protein
MYLNPLIACYLKKTCANVRKKMRYEKILSDKKSKEFEYE